MSKRVPVTPSIIADLKIPNSKVEHIKKYDCRYCITDKHGRATGKYVKIVQEKKCRKCVGTGKTSNAKKCTHCKKGIFIWRSPLVDCKVCEGTGHKDGVPIQSMGVAFEKAKKALCK